MPDRKAERAPNLPAVAEGLSGGLGQLGPESGAPNRQVVQLLGGVPCVLCRFVDNEAD